jgi:hypothetical protein
MGSIDLWIITAFALGVVFTLIVSKLARTIFLESIMRPLDRGHIVIYPGGELAIEKDADVKLLSAITTAMVAVTGGDTDPTLTDEAINMLEKSLREHPGERRAAILSGRLYADNKANLPKAIQVLSGALEAIDKRRIEQKGYAADILYNLACYYVRMAQQAESNVDRERFRPSSA